ncbi:unnamed protein product [Blepharisma stoltei]|uniref:F-box/kelch-repeat protein n=1 Tax=Blepharisma stoltei TaxID=1481888 RepID=A0AAU9IU58_9CILI|nr:unnamed protein product [Blepharisma stoltei]
MDSYSDLTLSERFDLNGNQWIKLRPLPNSDFSCNSIVFNGDILISGAMSCNLLHTQLIAIHSWEFRLNVVMGKFMKAIWDEAV